MRRRRGADERTVKDKAQHAVVMDKTIQERLNKDVLTYRLITTAVLVDRLKINGSLARKALAELEQKGVIKKIVGHHKLNIYSTFQILGGRNESREADYVCSSRCCRCRVEDGLSVSGKKFQFSYTGVVGSSSLCVRAMRIKKK
jgi:small subunit ribosomal protein S25e